MKKQLTSEVDNKKSVIGSLSKELEIHQKNFNELKDELNKVKKTNEVFYFVDTDSTYLEDSDTDSTYIEDSDTDSTYLEDRRSWV